MPPQAKANNLVLENVPPEFKDLNPMEIRLISLRIPFMKMVALPCGKQKGIHGPAVNIPADLHPVCDLLPRLPSQAQVVPMKLKRKLSYKGHYMYQYVQPAKVLLALEWLKKNNPLYKDVAIDQEWVNNADRDDSELWEALSSQQCHQSFEEANSAQQYVSSNRTFSLLVSLAGDRGFTARNVPGDGDCLFHSVQMEDHIQYISTKVSRGITLLRHLATFLPRRALCYYYNAYILPQFSYADSVWNTCTRAQSIKLERLQNFAARVILSRRRDSSATEMRQELGWPTLTSRRTLSTAVMTYKSISGLNPPYLSVLFKPLSNHHVTRSSSTRGTCIPVIRNEYGRKSFAFQGAKMWNDLPAGLRSAANLDEFTKAARCLIFSSTA